ncbi:GDP dissociation inhibitor [Circinella umbellata]|nr:GDP dissociation inhibitor [Circinella umbellata]
MSNNSPQLLDETDFDVIVLGTGLIESIVAGALARAGKKVLHVDSNDHYGSNWSVFGFKELLRWNQSQQKSKKHSIEYHRNYRENYHNVAFKLYQQPSLYDKVKSHLLIDATADKVLIEESINNEVKNIINNDLKNTTTIDLQPSISKLTVLLNAMRASRSYNLDLTPKLLSCNGELVEILIRSGVGRYLEFKGVDDIGIYDSEEGRLDRVPSSKQDVFTNKSINLVDKRKLMRFLTFAIDFNSNPDVLEGKRGQEKKNYKLPLSMQLQTLIIKVSSTKVGLEQTQAFVRSMGRFSKGGYLCPLYGGGSEIAQAFCRVCAVFGGVYILSQELNEFLIDENTSECKGIETKDGQKFNANWVVTGIDYLDNSWVSPSLTDFEKSVSRAIVVTDKPLVSFGENDEMLCYSVFPPGSSAGNHDKPVLVIHQNHETMACPRGEYVTYLWKESPQEDQNVLEKAIELLLPEDAHIKFSLVYSQRSRHITRDDSWNLPKNIIPCSDPTSSLTFEEAIREAMEIFFECVPKDTSFMPEQPQDPEEDY